MNKYLDIELILQEDSDLTKYMEDEDLKALGRHCAEEFDEDEASRQEWLDRSEEYMKLAMQVAEYKSFPWPDAANIKYPILSTASIQFASRAYSGLIGNSRPVKGKVIGYDTTGEKLNQAIRVSKHMSYQVLEQMEGWEEDMDKLCMILPILGCVFKKTYYDPIKQQPVSEMVLPKHLAVDYFASNINKARRISHIIEYNENDIVERINRGLFADIEIPTRVYNSGDYRHDDLSREIDGREIGDEGLDDTYMFIEQHMWLDLDGDGYKEPYIATVSLDNEEVYRLVRRFTREDVEFSEDGKDTILAIEPTQYFTKFGFIPNPDGGFYDIGFGLLLGPTNEVVNTILNQLIDAGTMSSMQSGFLGRGIRLKKGSTSFSPGEWKQVNNTGEDLKKSILPLPVREPSSVLFQLLGMLVNSAKELSSVSDMMMGKNPGQNQPATTSMAVLEQGQEVFSSIFKRQYRALKQEFKLIYKINALNMPDRAFFQVLDMGEDQGGEVYKADYNLESVTVTPSADPNIASDSMKLMKSQGLMELLQLGTVNPQEVTRRILEAQEQYGIEKLMEVAPPQPDPELVLRAKELDMEKEKADAANETKIIEALIAAESQGARLEFDSMKAFVDNVHRDKERRFKEEEMMQAKEEQQQNGQGTIQ